MNSATPAIRDLARRLIAIEAARENGPTNCSGDVVCVCDRLRLPLTKLAGVAGFRSLMSRAVAIAKVEDASLQGLLVSPDGSLEGIDEAGVSEEVGHVLVANLLGLLVTFIGEPLTMRLVHDAWPNASVIGTGERKGDGR